MHKKDSVVSSLDDFFSPKIIFITFVSFLITIVIITSLLFLAFGNASSLKELAPEVFAWFTEVVMSKIEARPMLSFVLEHETVMMIFRFVMYFGFGIVVYFVFLTIYGVVVGFFASIIVKYVQKKHYPKVKIEGIGIISTAFFYVKTILIALVLLVLLSPSYIIPGLNFLIFVPIFYFFHKTLVFDVSSVVNTGKEYKKIKKVNWGELKARTGLCFALTFIPIIGIIIYPYYVICISHYILKETTELRAHQDFKRN